MAQTETVTALILKYNLRTVVLNQLNLENPNLLQDNTDFFSLGLTSFHVLQIATRIQQSDDADLGWVKYETINKNPTLASLAGRLARGVDDLAAPTPTADTVLVDQMVVKYSNFVNHNVTARVSPNGRVVLLTGATGSLGGHIAAQLAANDTVTKVYCLVRPSRHSTKEERLNSALTKVGLNVSRAKEIDVGLEDVPTTDPEFNIYPDYTCTPEQLAKIVPYSTDLTRQDLGLTQPVYTTLRETVTDVIHCAWSVNYDIGLSSFEHHILGAYNLMSLCLNSKRDKPAAFHFISSIAATSADPIEEIHYNNSSTVSGGLGYGQSKFVVERLCEIATRKVPTMVARVLRLGYISGESMTGNWDTREEYPMIAKSAIKIGVLPKPPGDEILNWITVNDAAKVCIELVLKAAAAPKDAVFNVAHPDNSSWNDVFLPGILRLATSIETTSPSEWIAKLEGEVFPPYPLLGYYKRKYFGDIASHSVIKTDEARKYSVYLRTCKVLDMDLVGKYVQSWDLEEQRKKYIEAEAAKRAEIIEQGRELARKNAALEKKKAEIAKE